MKRAYLLLLFVFIVLHNYAADADTLYVVSHNQTTVVTDPASGLKSYKKWAVFPSSGVALRRINLKVIFGCPDSIRCADWDYLDHIYIRRKGGVNGPSLDYPIGRMLTPYGGAFARDWRFEWATDITDFSLVLRDSVEIEYQHSGYEPANDRGWKITVAFELIKGVPVREPLHITKVYDGSFAYGDSTKDIEQQLQPVLINTVGKATQARLLVYQTGHGMDANGCGEFCNRYREIWWDGHMIDRRSIWKECGDNPLYPQAGTWVIDRAYWCPGYLQQPDAFELSLSNGREHHLDINMQPYVTAKPGANEVLTAYLVQYGKTTLANDAAIEDVMVPTDKQAHLRFNPSAMHPTVIIKNLGTNRLENCIIQFGTDGFASRQFYWRGNLGFHEQDTVRLPGGILAKDGLNRFTVKLLQPNKKRDKDETDNVLSVPFHKVPVHGNTLILDFFTNLQPDENSYQLKDVAGNILYERKAGSLKAATSYRDTFQLQPGHYEWLLKDTGDNGLEFWFNTRGGRGFVRLLDGEGRMIKNFDSDFGSNLYYGFEVTGDTTAKWSAPVAEPAVGLFPTRTKGKTTMDYFGNQPERVVVKLVTDPGGAVIEEHVYEALKEAILTYDLSYRPAQRYYFKVYVGDRLVYNKRLRVGQ